MKKFYFSFFLSLIISLGYSQTPFWTENFAVGCNQLQLAAGFNSGNGPWVVTPLSGYVSSTGSDEWFVSATEAGMGAGNCGNGCLGTGGTNQTLHIGNSSSALTFLCTSGDCGAIYNAAIFSDQRAESPVINCTGQNNFFLRFNYLENGQGALDDGDVWYSIAAGPWALLGNPAKTTCGTAVGCAVTPCTGFTQGIWTTYTINMPAAAFNQANVRVGFRWKNNGDNVGTDPSYALDDIQLLTPPTFTPTFVLASPACSGNTATLTAGTGTVACTGFTWTSNPAGVTITSPNASVTPISYPAAGTFTITLTATSGGTNTGSTTHTVLVNASPTVTALSNPVSVCVGQSATITAAGATTYTWSPGASLNTINGAVVIATPPANTTYTILGTTGACTGSTTILLTTTPPLTLNIAASTPTVCAGGSATLTIGGATTYSWSPGASLNTTNGPQVVASPIVGTTYTVVGQTGTCLSSTVITIGMGSNLNLVITPTAPSVCLGGGVSISVTGATNYTWTPGATLNTTSGATVIASPPVATTYTVFGQSGTCNGFGVINVTMGPPLPIGIGASLSPTICPGGSCTLTANGGTSYTWSPATGLSTTGPGGVTVASPTINTLYTVVGSNTTGCIGTNSINVVIGPPLTVTVTPSTATTCVGGAPVNLTATGATNYVWSPSGTLTSPFGPNVVASPSTTTQYTVLGSTGTCTGLAVATITVIPPPTITVTPTYTTICLGTCYTYTASGTGTNSYTWSPCFTLNSCNGSTVSACPATTTNYTIIGQTALGCLSLPITFTCEVVPIPTATPALQTNTLGVATNSICAKFPNTLTLTASTSAAPNLTTSITYTWVPIGPPGGLIGGANNSATVFGTPTISACSPNAKVTYSLFVSYNILPGCKSVGDTVTARLVNCYPPIATFTTAAKNDTTCTNSCITLINTTCGGQPQIVHWYAPGGKPDTSTAQFPVICYNIPGTYTVAMAVSNPYGYDSLIKKNYIVVVDTPNTKAGKDTCIRFGSCIQLHGTQANYFSWSPSNGLSCTSCSNTGCTNCQINCPSPYASPTVTTKYVVTGYNSKKCSYKDTIEVCVIFDCGEMFVPNAFSPNKDGHNDVLYVRGKCLSNFIFQIFNRWGEKVFESNRQDLGWDGNYNDEPMNTGVFVFRLEGTTVDNQPFSMKGNITLIR